MILLIGLVGCSVNTPEAEQAKLAVSEWYRSRQFIDIPVECIECIYQNGDKYTIKVYFNPKKLYPELKEDDEIPVHKGKFHVKKDGDIYEVFNSNDECIYTYSDKTSKTGNGYLIDS